MYDVKEFDLQYEEPEVTYGCIDNTVVAKKRHHLPPPSLDDIHIFPAPWVPPHLISLFLKEELNFEEAPKVIFNKLVYVWQIDIMAKGWDSVANTETYGILQEDLIFPWGKLQKNFPYNTGLQLFESAMNGDPVVIYEGTDRDAPVDQAATVMAHEKQAILLRDFDQWCRADPQRRALLERCYQDAFGNLGICSYDGSLLTFPDLNPEVELYPYQKDAVARILCSKENVLLAHRVGTGKSYEFCVGVHELHRLNISRRNLVVSPNNVLKATADLYHRLYPKDRILVVYPKDFGKETRAEVLEKMRDGDYVVVFMASTSFDRLDVSKECKVRRMEERIAELRAGVHKATDPLERKLLLRKHRALCKKFKNLMTEVDPPWLTFDQLGFQTLVVDESDRYKNIPLTTKVHGVVGLHTAGAEKSRRMLAKVGCVEKAIFATGTPLPNSIADLFVLQQYLQADELKFRGINSLEMWLNTFAEQETNFELDVAGKCRMTTRFNKFHNLPELLAMFSNVCDFYMGSSEESLPQFNGYIDIEVRKSSFQERFFKSLPERAERVHNGKVPRTEDNLLKITVEARMYALHERLMEPELSWKCTGFKVRACGKQVEKYYKEYPNTCQIVFCDIGTPKEGFNVYDCLKEDLVRRGIPEEQIAYVHDATTEAARTKLFAAMNAGTLRVVIGSTEKLGVGVNVQQRLIAVHHLSVPWRPADMEQREGRILRPGNTCKEVFILRYVTRDSFDAYSWQLLENKQRFVGQFLSGAMNGRDMEDISDTVLSYAEVKALAIGSGLVRKRVEEGIELERIRMACRERQRQMINLRERVENAPMQIAYIQEQIQKIRRDAAYYKENRVVVPQEERIAFGEELLIALSENHMKEEERFFDRYQGFDICLPARMDRTAPYIRIRSADGEYVAQMNTEKPLGCAMRIDNQLEDLTKRAEALEEKIRLIERQKEESMRDLAGGNPYSSRIGEMERSIQMMDRMIAKLQEKESA